LYEPVYLDINLNYPFKFLLKNVCTINFINLYYSQKLILQKFTKFWKFKYDINNLQYILIYDNILMFIKK